MTAPVLNNARVARLDAEMRCPACGAQRNGATGGVNSAGDLERLTVYFDCGAIFACEAGRPISADLACPGSSEVAAAALDREARGEISIRGKDAENRTRRWPDWRNTDPNLAIERDRSGATVCDPDMAGVRP